MASGPIGRIDLISPDGPETAIKARDAPLPPAIMAQPTEGVRPRVAAPLATDIAFNAFAWALTEPVTRPSAQKPA
jgi:hypothetical protein